MCENETIAAISTAFGEGGIGIVRISGAEALHVLQKIFVPAGTGNVSSAGVSSAEHASDCGDNATAFQPVSRMMYYGMIMDPADRHKVDEVMAVYMKAPHTYTREDVVEIDSHGSMVSLRKILSLCYQYGASPAARGEFTKRAFLNGRLDLSQAESVMDLIRAKTDATFDVALEQLQGRLSDEIRTMRQNLMDLLVDMTVNIDYPDEDIEEIIYERMQAQLDDVKKSVDRLLASSDTGRIIRDGLRVAIIGRPNVGKSSLMNALLGENRAIVTDVPGTTRDTIEESLSIHGIPVRLTDTAGIRETEDTIEKIGIERSKDSFNQSDLIVLMVDGSVPLTKEDHFLLDRCRGRKAMVLINKKDEGIFVSEEEIGSLLPDAVILRTSMKEQVSIDAIENEVTAMVHCGGVVQQDSTIVTNARHEQLLRDASHALADAMDAAAGGEPLELIEIDVHEGYDRLGEILGESVSDDIIQEVFSRFCLGK